MRPSPVETLEFPPGLQAVEWVKYLDLGEPVAAHLHRAEGGSLSSVLGHEDELIIVVENELGLIG